MLDYKPLFDVGEGEPIILLNGLIGNLSNWGHVVYEFTSSNRVLIPRMPFYQVPISPSRLNDLVTYLEKFIDAHALDKVSLIGNSFGGHLALLYAWRQPSRVKKLILASSSGIFENAQTDLVIGTMENDLSLVLENNTIYNSRAKALKGDIKEIFARVNGQSNEITEVSNPVLQHYAECSILHHIYAPALLIWGVNDTITPPEVALAFHEHLPQSKIIFLDQCGHLPMIDQPKLFNQHVREFLER